MPNLQIAYCTCYPRCAGACGITGGDATTASAFCTPCLDNSCANAAGTERQILSFTVPTFNIECSDQINNGDTFRWSGVTIPEYDFNVVLGKNAESCTGSEESCKWEYQSGGVVHSFSLISTSLCAGGSDFITRYRFPLQTGYPSAEYPQVSIDSYASVMGSLRMNSPCGSVLLDASPPDCEGIVLTLPLMLHRTSAGGGQPWYNIAFVYLVMGYNLSELDDCDDDVGCPSVYNYRTPDLFWSNVADASAPTNVRFL